MNFLAHMLLSCENDSLMTGNFLGDLMTKREVIELPEAIQEGVRLHRKIDVFTDNHPAVRLSTRLLHARHGKYAPVLVDVYYDFFLSRHWERYYPAPLAEFAQKVYGQLVAHLDIMPEHTQRIFQTMVRENWLLKYTSYEGMEFTFHKMSKRVSKPEQLLGAVDSLKLFENNLEGHFLIFFPELLAYVQVECASYPSK